MLVEMHLREKYRTDFAFLLAEKSARASTWNSDPLEFESSATIYPYSD